MLEYTYLRTRLFGSLFALPGLNYIFRGGLLPRNRRGRTYLVEGKPGVGKTLFALHMMADMARRGQLAVYASFEESYESIYERLYTFGLFDVSKYETIHAGADIEEQIRKRRPDAHGNRENPAQPKGLLILYGRHNPSIVQLEKMLESVARAASGDDARDRGYWKWRAIAIDSLEGIDWRREARTADRDSSVPELRAELRGFVNLVEEKGLWGLLLSAGRGERASALAGLAETWIRLTVDREGETRWIEIQKCRTQNYQPGRHPFRIREGLGIRIYPSLDAVRSSVRRQLMRPLDPDRLIVLPKPIQVTSSNKTKRLITGVIEGSSILIRGPEGTGKTDLMLRLATSAVVSDGIERAQGPRGVVIVNFRTPEARFLQTMRHISSDYAERWEKIPSHYLRWFSPGARLSGPQIVAWLMEVLREAQLAHRPIERLVFNEVASADRLIPTLAEEPLFLSTLLALGTTYGLTTMFVVNEESALDEIDRVLMDGCNYVLRTSAAKGKRVVEVTKVPVIAIPQGAAGDDRDGRRARAGSPRRR